MKKLPRVPPYNLKKIAAQREQMRAIIKAEGYIDEIMTISSMAHLACKFAEVCKREKQDQTIFKSILSMAGFKMDEAKAKEISWRIAGNQRYLKKGLSIYNWTLQMWDEWVPVEISHVEIKNRKSDGKLIINPSYLVLAGTPSGKRFTRSFPYKFLPILAGDVGFGKNKWDTEVCELLRMRINVYLLEGDTLHFDDYKSRAKHNKKIISARDGACKKGFEHSCTECWFGIDKCPYATRLRTLELRDCPNGHKGYYDPDIAFKYCIECGNKKK